MFDPPGAGLCIKIILNFSGHFKGMFECIVDAFQDYFLGIEGVGGVEPTEFR